MTLLELLFRQRENNKIAIKYGNENISYKEWYTKSTELGKYILQVDRSENIGIYLPNSINYAVAYFSCLYANKTIVPLEIQSTASEIAKNIEYCDISYVITTQKDKKKIHGLIDILKREVKLILINEFEFSKIANHYLAKEMSKGVLEEDTAIMLHTSGTTSNPKRVMLTHKNLLSNVTSNIQSLELTSDDVILIALPMYFGYCNTAQFLTGVFLGCTLVIMREKFIPRVFLNLVEKERVSFFTAVPSMLSLLLDADEYNNYNFSSLRIVCFGGGMIKKETIRSLIEKFPDVGFIQTYGQTECSPRVTMLEKKYELSKIGSIGKPIPGVKVKIVDNNKTVARGEVGEILVQGDNIMKGYYKNKEATDKIKKGGWLHTGDLAYEDEEGFLYLAGRRKNIIISNGINIYPEEVEERLKQYPNVREALVVGISDDNRGEVPVAYILVERESKMDVTELKKFCMKTLSMYKVPKEIFVVDTLQRTYTGKLKRYTEESRGEKYAR